MRKTTPAKGTKPVPAGKSPGGTEQATLAYWERVQALRAELARLRATR